LIEQLAKNMLLIKDSVYNEILTFLDGIEMYGDKI